MANVSHRDPDGSLPDGVYNLTGVGSPEGVVSAAVGSMFRRLDGSTGATLYIKEGGGSGSTGWVAQSDSSAAVTSLDARLDTAEAEIDALQAADVTLDGRLDTAESDIIAVDNTLSGALADITSIEGDITSLQTDLAALEADVISGDASLDGRLDTAETEIDALQAADITLESRLDAVEANDWVTTARVANGQITLAKMADLANSRIIGRVTTGTGVPEALTNAQVTGLLDTVTTAAKGLVPTAPNVVRQVLRGNATWGVPKQTWIASFSCDTVTAGNTDRFLNPAGYATSPAGTTGFFYTVPFTGNLVRTQVLMSTVHTTNTFTVTPQYDGAEATTQVVSIAANTGTADTTHATPLAVVAGKALACRVDHNGATNVRFITVNFFIEES